MSDIENTVVYINNPREYRTYRAKRDGGGTALAVQLSHKPKNKYEPWIVFLTLARQIGSDEDGNARFQWKREEGAANPITVKFGENDLGEFIAVLSGAKGEVGTGKGLFHQVGDAGNKVINFVRVDKGYNLKVSSKHAGGVDSMYLTLSDGEAAVLLTLLRQAVVKIYNW